MPTQAPASDPPFYRIFVPQQFLFSKNFIDVITCDLWFGLPPTPTKNPDYTYIPRQCFFVNFNQRWSRGHKTRSQGQGQGHKNNPRPRPRTAFPRTDPLEAKDRNARGQGPRTKDTAASVLKKKVFKKVF